MGQRARNLKLSDAADSTTSSWQEKRKKRKQKEKRKLKLLNVPSLFQTIISRLCVLLIIENIFSFF